MRQGSLPWLLRHEVRVRWREMIGETSPSTVILLGLGLFLFAHVMLWQLVSPLKGTLTPLPPEAVFLAAVLLLVLVPFGLTIGINHSVVALFERGDLDLLVSSPISSRTIFASRVLGVAAGVFVTLGVFVLPVATLGLMLGLPQLLGALPLLLAISLVCAGLGMLVTLALVRLIGPRRARSVSQVLAAVGGMALFLLTQVPALFGGGQEMSERMSTWLTYFQPGGPLSADSAVWFPAKTLFLDPVPTLVTLALSAAVAWAVVGLLHRSFANGLGLVDSPGRRRVRRDAAAMRFSGRGTMHLLVSKEWKLLLRDPFLLSQTLLQLIYLLPVAYIIFFTDNGGFLSNLDIGPALALVLVVATSGLASALARISVVGEEVPDLLVASPIPGSAVRRAKLLSALLPVWVLSLPLLGGLIAYYPLPGIVGAVMVAASTLSVTTIRLWNPVTAKRSDLFKRRSLGDPVLGILEGISPMLWAVATYLVATVNPWALIPTVAAVLVQFVCFGRARTKGFAYGV